MLRKCYQKSVGLIIKIPYLRTSKLSKDWLDDILDIFFNYFIVIKGVFCSSGTRPTLKFLPGLVTHSKFDLKGYKKKVWIKHENFFMFARLKTL